MIKIAKFIKDYAYSATLPASKGGSLSYSSSLEEHMRVFLGGCLLICYVFLAVSSSAGGYSFCYLYYLGELLLIFY